MLYVKKLIQKGESIKDHPFFVVKTMVISWSFKNVFLNYFSPKIPRMNNSLNMLDNKKGVSILR